MKSLHTIHHTWLLHSIHHTLLHWLLHTITLHHALLLHSWLLHHTLLHWLLGHAIHHTVSLHWHSISISSHHTIH